MATIVLVTGGARSGKSAFAEAYCRSLSERPVYIATAIVADEEMAQRVQSHRARRGTEWTTLEVPRHIESGIEEAFSLGSVVLVDCVTLYMSTYLYDHRDEESRTSIEGALREWDAVLSHIRREKKEKTVVFVTNELGNGIVPMDALSRQYRDMVGLINQRIAKAATRVFLTVSGITTELKARQFIIEEQCHD